MNLPDLIDLEVQLLRDEQDAAPDSGPDAATRDRAIGLRVADELGATDAEMGQRLARDRSLRHRVCTSWLAELPKAVRKSLPGARLVHRYRVLGWILAGIGFLSGVGAALAALHGTDDRPINVLVFIVLFFALQILLLALYPIALLVRTLRRDGGRLPWLQSLVVRVGRLRWLDRWTGGASAELPENFQRLRLRNNIYGRVLQWQLFSMVQRLGTAFNLAALLTTLFMVAFHDLALCCWSTTLDLTPTALHEGLRWLGAPWSFLPFGEPPSLEAVHYSRWVTSDSSGYLPVPDSVDAPALRRTWWPFLIAGLICWGLLPRLVAATLSAVLGRREANRVPLTHRAVQELFDRLYPPTPTWSGPAPEEVAGPAPRPKATQSRRRPKNFATAASTPSHLVCWGSLHDEAPNAAAHLTRRFQRSLEAPLAAGLADVAVEQATIDALTRAKARRVILALPEGQQPTKDVMRFLTTLRTALSGEAELLVCLLATEAGGTYTDVDEDEREAWQQRLLAEGDPYLSLQTVGAPG